MVRNSSPVSRCRTAFPGRLFWWFLEGLERPSYKERRLLHPETEEPVLHIPFYRRGIDLSPEWESSARCIILEGGLLLQRNARSCLVQPFLGMGIDAVVKVCTK